jgi:hypothetical protein
MLPDLKPHSYWGRNLPDAVEWNVDPLDTTPPETIPPYFDHAVGEIRRIPGGLMIRAAKEPLGSRVWCTFLPPDTRFPQRLHLAPEAVVFMDALPGTEIGLSTVPPTEYRSTGFYVIVDG